MLSCFRQSPKDGAKKGGRGRNMSGFRNEQLGAPERLMEDLGKSLNQEREHRARSAQLHLREAVQVLNES